MANRFFLTDVVQNGIYRSPSHFGGRAIPADSELAAVRAVYFDYGLIPQCIVYAPVTPAEEAYLDALPDVLAVPENLDGVIPAGRIAEIQSKLEDRDIPGNWITISDTYRTALREILWYFAFMQQYTQITQYNPIAAGINLGATVGAPAINNWEALKLRWHELLATIDPSSVTAENPAGSLYSLAGAWAAVTVEAQAQGMSLANIRKAALIVVLEAAPYDVSAIVAGTTLRQVLRGLAAQNSGRTFVFSGVSV